VPEEIAELYASGGEHKHEATARLMQRVEAALGTVTISAADYETLEFFWTLRRLTSNDQREHDAGSKLMSLERQVAFVRRFGRGYDRLLADGTPFKESPRVQHVRSLCRDYNKQLKAMGMRDYQVAFVLDELSRPRAVALLASRVLLLLLYAVRLR
jgi:glycerol-3-phosphate O-acyltransferase/dihydroxyacetone phosphate acyltransferase